MSTDPKDQQATDNDNASAHDDTIGENTGDTSVEKGESPGVQDKPDDTRVKTVTPDNDNDALSQSDDSQSNKDQGPSGENL
jgi:hypothetical protein